MTQSLERQIYTLFDNLRRQIKAQPLNLGGISGGLSDSGGPPGGFLGQLPQSRINFDPDELEDNLIPASGIPLPSGQSLVTNLNRMRYRLSVLETSGIGGASNLSIEEDDTPIASNVTILNFEGGVSVFDEGSGEVRILISGGDSGGPGSITVQEGLATVASDVTTLNFEGGGISVFEEEAGVATVSLPNQGVTILEDSGVTAEEVTSINFLGSASVVDDGGGQVSVTVSGTGGGGVTDHGALTGLSDDDHTQYHNDARGDARYLYRENTTPFTPDGDYEPATKKYVDDSIDVLEIPSGISTFLELTDTPETYTGHANKAVFVKPDETGLDFVVISGVGSSTNTIIVEEEGGGPPHSPVDTLRFRAPLNVDWPESGVARVELNHPTYYNDDESLGDVNIKEIRYTGDVNVELTEPVSGYFVLNVNSDIPESILHIYGETPQEVTASGVGGYPELDSFNSKIQNSAETELVLSVTVPDEENLLMLVGVGMRGGIQVSTANFNADALSKIADEQPGGDVRGELWKLDSPDAGTHDLTVNVNAAQVINVGVVILSNVDIAGGSTGTPTKSSATDANPTITVDSPEDSLVIDVYCDQAAGSEPAPGESGQTEIIDLQGAFSDLGMSQRQRQAATTVMSWDLNGSDAWTHIGVAVNGLGVVPTGIWSVSKEFIANTLRVYNGGTRVNPTFYTGNGAQSRFTQGEFIVDSGNFFVDFDYLESSNQ